jgi:hypothetical protein
MIKNISIILSLLICQITFGQEKKRCLVEEILAIEKASNPNYLKNKTQFELKVFKEIQTIENKSFRVGEEVIRIPVVVHVIHNNAAGLIGGLTNTNISDEQIYSQIKVLNEDYRKKTNTRGFNTDPVGADTQVEFFLATKDPQGNPSTGIVRVYNNQTNYDIISEREKLSRLSYWDSNKYLNIWVVNMKDDYLGYGEFPGGQGVDGIESEDAAERTDGVFINYTAFGREIGSNTSGLYRYGRTTTHEVGHWFGLIHTWGDEFCGTDYCNDTPTITGPNRRSTCVSVNSTCNGTRVRNMTENYMDYSPDECMNIFTGEQSKRIRAVIEVSKRRKRVVNYAKFELPPSSKLDVSISPNPAAANNISIQVLLPDFQDFNIEIYDILGRNVYQQSFKDLPSTVVTLKDKGFQAGQYILKVYSKNDVVTKRIVLY